MMGGLLIKRNTVWSKMSGVEWSGVEWEENRIQFKVKSQSDGWEMHVIIKLVDGGWMDQKKSEAKKKKMLIVVPWENIVGGEEFVYINKNIYNKWWISVIDKWWFSVK